MITQTPSSEDHFSPRLRDMLGALVPLRMLDFAADDWHPLKSHRRCSYERTRASQLRRSGAAA